MKMTESIIGQSEFTDGAVRTVYQGDDGRQFVFDDDERVVGVWLDPAQSAPDPPVEKPANGSSAHMRIQNVPVFT
jgi:hypothetical protein